MNKRKSFSYCKSHHMLQKPHCWSPTRPPNAQLCSVWNRGHARLLMNASVAWWAQGEPPSASTLHLQRTATRASKQRLPSSATTHIHFSLSPSTPSQINIVHAHPLKHPWSPPLSTSFSREPHFGTSTPDSKSNIQSEGSWVISRIKWENKPLTNHNFHFVNKYVL
jgi:hypothetical protein